MNIIALTMLLMMWCLALTLRGCGNCGSACQKRDCPETNPPKSRPLEYMNPLKPPAVPVERDTKG